MPTSVTDYFKLDEVEFKKTDAFDSLVDWDTKLFVDPFLLQKCKTPEFKGAHDELLKYFSKNLKLIGASKHRDDLAWKTAKKRLQFREIGAFGLGYSNESTFGSGIGRNSSDQLISTLKEIYDSGISDPELFELLGLFQDGVGADRISDMTCNVLIRRFADFTQRVFRIAKFNGICATWSIDSSKYAIPAHPFRKSSPILLAPREILRDLPVAEDGFDIVDVYAANEDLRNKLNQLLGNQWRQDLKKYGKAQFRTLFRSNPEYLREVLSAYKKLPIQRYNFSADRSGEIIWREYAQKVVRDFPLHLALDVESSFKEFCDVVEKICIKFKEHVENNGLWEALYDDRGKPRKE